MPAILASLCLGWKLPGLYTLGVESLEHAALMRRPAAARKTSTPKKIKIYLSSIPFALTFWNCLN
jgi:hypothetical protein